MSATLFQASLLILFLKLLHSACSADDTISADKKGLLISMLKNVTLENLVPSASSPSSSDRTGRMYNPPETNGYDRAYGDRHDNYYSSGRGWKAFEPEKNYVSNGYSVGNGVNGKSYGAGSSGYGSAGNSANYGGGYGGGSGGSGSYGGSGYEDGSSSYGSRGKYESNGYSSESNYGGQKDSYGGGYGGNYGGGSYSNSGYGGYYGSPSGEYGSQNSGGNYGSQNYGGWGSQGYGNGYGGNDWASSLHIMIVAENRHVKFCFM